MTDTTHRQALVGAGLLAETDIEGLYHRSFAFERVVRGVESYVSALVDVPSDRQFYFAPFISTATMATTGYARTFPNLLGAVSSYHGTEREVADLIAKVESGAEWVDDLGFDGLFTCSAACHSLYPLLRELRVAEPVRVFEVQGTCFRHEPSADVARMQSFRQHEFVAVGEPDAVATLRDHWLEIGVAALRALGLVVDSEVANDPFFGRAGKILASGQRERGLKLEMVSPLSSPRVGAIGSVNYHEDHFAGSFSISTSSSPVAHTACIGFGLERITLALTLRHGVVLEEWPAEVRAALALD